MAYVSNTYEGSHIASVDLEQIEDNFEYLRTNFKGGSAPTNPGGGLEGVIWRDTSKDILKVMGSVAWQGILALQKPGDTPLGLIWLHDNDANQAEGWGIDTTITEDRVIALKNHTAGAGTYKTGRVAAGGAGANNWVISGISVANHSAHAHSMQGHKHLVTILPGGDNTITGIPSYGGDYDSSFYSDVPNITNTGNNLTTLTHTVTQDGQWRIRAQVGIVIYPNM